MLYVESAWSEVLKNPSRYGDGPRSCGVQGGNHQRKRQQRGRAGRTHVKRICAGMHHGAGMVDDLLRSDLRSLHPAAGNLHARQHCSQMLTSEPGLGPLHSDVGHSKRPTHKRRQRHRMSQDGSATRMPGSVDYNHWRSFRKEESGGTSPQKLLNDCGHSPLHSSGVCPAHESVGRSLEGPQGYSPRQQRSVLK